MSRAGERAVSEEALELRLGVFEVGSDLHDVLEVVIECLVDGDAIARAILKSE